MEIAVIIFIVWLVATGIKIAINSGSKSGSTSGSLSPFQIRLIDEKVGDNKDLDVKTVQTRGLIPLDRQANINFVLSLLQKSGEDWRHVLCSMDWQQEPETIAYQHTQQVGPMEPNYGFTEWISVGCIIPDTLKGPYGGKQTLMLLLRIVDADNPPSIRAGYHESDRGIYYQTSLEFEYTFEEPGYQEEDENREEAQALILQLSVSIAMADGELADSEAEVITNWIRKILDTFTNDDRVQSLKEHYNAAMRDALRKAKNGSLSLSHITARLREIGSNSIKYDAIELCHEVMAADGEADPNELSQINNIAAALELDPDEIARIRDRSMIRLDASKLGTTSDEDLVGIDPNWSRNQIEKHLKKEFRKSNARITTVTDENERKTIQEMLDAIARLRQKYRND